MRGTGSRGGLRGRLLLAEVGIVVVTATVLVAVMWTVAPSVFADHLRQAGETDPLVVAHAEEAFLTSLLIGVGAALVVSAVAAALVALVTSRRLAAPFTDLARAADQVSHGHFDVPVLEPRIGTEAEHLARAFRDMAARLSRAEAERRRHQNDLAHELRSPLATLVAHVEAMQDGVLDADPTTLAAMTAQLRRVNRLVEDLRTLAAAEERTLSLTPVPVDLAAEVLRAVAVAHPQAEAAGIRLTATTVAARTVTDPDRLAQILANLLANAVRHTATGGRIDVGMARDGATTRITVHDDGAGIDPQDLPHVFQRLYRGDASRRYQAGTGSGLGLSISRALARALGGELSATSPGPLGGASLDLVLPADDGYAIARRAQPITTRPARAASSRSGNLLKGAP